MEEIEKSEQLIKNILHSIPRKNVDQGSKKTVWLRVQNSIRDSRAASPVQAKRLSFIFQYTKLTVSALSIALLVVLVTATTTAAKTSLPGQTLYSVKKAVEKVEKTLATSDEKKVKVLSEHVQNRLTEVQTLVATKQASEKVVTKTLEDLESSTKELEEVATSALDKNPKLVEEVIELADQRENALIEVGDNLEDGETKTALNKTLNASRESVAALKATKGDVEGAVTAKEEVVEEKQATSTPIKTPRPIVEPKKEEPKEVIESPIQIHDVIKGNDEEDVDQSSEPKILPDTNS